jgi:UDP-2,3-diacylglucosamine pyrophosphatase LpxH
VDERITLIASDLHVGGGPHDPGDDHVYHKNQLASFIREQAASANGRAGRIELFFNGDFLEFAQTDVDAFAHVSDERWCTEQESLRKLETIIRGHRDIFDALRDFQVPGNVVTIAAGNHDVDLYWDKVQARLREVAGAGLRFEVGSEWVERYGGKLQIAHGHMNDVANRFEHWEHPFVAGDFGVECLEMCAGTLFMVKFVNKLEAEYPFADNLLPVTKLASVLMRDDKAGYVSVGWMFARLVATTSGSVLEAGAADDYGARLLRQIQNSPTRAARLDAVLAAHGLEDDRKRLAAKTLTEERLAEVMFTLLGRVDGPAWQALFELEHSGVVLGDDGITLSAIYRAGNIDGKEELRKAATKRARQKRASVVVMGHTHQEDELKGDGFVYFNPGSWTRYLELQEGRRVTLDELKDETKYPYALNMVRVEPVGGELRASMVCVDRWDAGAG